LSHINVYNVKAPAACQFEDIILPQFNIPNSQHACLKSRQAQIVLEHLIGNKSNKPTNIVAQVTYEHDIHATTHVASSSLSISHQPHSTQYEAEPAGLLNYAATNICIHQPQHVKKHLEEVIAIDTKF
jgi:hypothetical protein